MSNENIYRIAVISDVHAHMNAMDSTSGKDIPSWVTPKAPSNSRQNPLADLKPLIAANNLRADILLCPGDIADKADDAAMNYAWAELNAIALELGSSALVGAVGNHDLHSRGAPGLPAGSGVPGNPSPSVSIRQLTPQFPLKDEEEARRYWADYVAVHSDEHCRIVTLNSCASHGYISEGDDEYKKGRFSHEAEVKLKALIEKTDQRLINILLTHHHPQQVSDYQFVDNSTMIRGDRLIHLLGSGDHGSWMIVHGHRHVANFQLAPGDVDRPYVFSAGSVGVIHSPIHYPDRPTNQFYMIEFDLKKIADEGSGLFGTLMAWDWHFGKGWKPASDECRVPSRSGFGNRTAIASLAKKVHEHIVGSAQENAQGVVKALPELEVAASVPEILYLMPSERTKFKGQLETLGIGLSRDPRNPGGLLYVYSPPLAHGGVA